MNFVARSAVVVFVMALVGAPLASEPPKPLPAAAPVPKADAKPVRMDRLERDVSSAKPSAQQLESEHAGNARRARLMLRVSVRNFSTVFIRR